MIESEILTRSIHKCNQYRILINVNIFFYVLKIRVVWEF